MKTYKNKFHTWEFKTCYITDDKDLKKILPRLGNTLYGLDIETAKLPKYKEHKQAGLCPLLSAPRLTQFYDGVATVYVIDLFTCSLGILKPFLQSGRFVAHNAVFEIQHLTHHGIPDMNIGCSMLLSQLIDGAEHSPFEPDEADEDNEDQTGLSIYRKKGHSLDALIQRLYGVKVSKQMQVSDWGAKTLSAEQITYAALDAVLTYHAAKALVPKLRSYKMERVYKLLKDMQHVVAAMQLTGLPVDWKYHAEMIKRWEKESAAALAKCKPHFGDVNLRSTKQMGEWLETYLKGDKLKLAAWPKTKKGQYAFGKSEITPLKHLEPVAALLEYKKWAKLIDTYGESLLEKKHPITKRLHTGYTLGETRTGRLSSKNPNVQNFPRDKEFRNMFKDTCMVVSDFSQIELRLQAEMSKDPVMRKTFKDKGDIYVTMASFLFNLPPEKITKEQRFVGKTTMLALAYGMGPKKLEKYATNAGVKEHPLSFWEKAHKTYHTTFRVYSNWCNQVRRRAEKLGYIDTLMGKRRKLTEDELYTRAPNTVIQGSAAELMMTAMLICFQNVKNYGNIVATVHDEILISCSKKNADKVKGILEDAMNESMKQFFPDAVSHHVADAEYGERWGDVKAEL